MLISKLCSNVANDFRDNYQDWNLQDNNVNYIYKKGDFELRYCFINPDCKWINDNLIPQIWSEHIDCTLKIEAERRRQEEMLRSSEKLAKLAKQSECL